MKRESVCRGGDHDDNHDRDGADDTHDTHDTRDMMQGWVGLCKAAVTPGRRTTVMASAMINDVDQRR